MDRRKLRTVGAHPAANLVLEVFKRRICDLCGFSLRRVDKCVSGLRHLAPKGGVPTDREDRGALFNVRRVPGLFEARGTQDHEGGLVDFIHEGFYEKIYYVWRGKYRAWIYRRVIF